MPLSNSPIYTHPGETRPFARPARAIHSVFVHCSASDNPQHDDVSVIRRWHTDPVHKGGRGWNDIGYHFLINNNGTVQPGRPVEHTPAAQVGHNAGALAVSLHGLQEKRFAPVQLASLVKLCRSFQDAYSGQTLRFRGHCEVANKACPVFNYRQELRLDAGGRLDRAGEANAPAFTQSLFPPDEQLDLMDHGSLVQTAQRALNARGANLAVDGVFGQRTREAVILFQQQHRLRADGVIGSLTRAELGF